MRSWCPARRRTLGRRSRARRAGSGRSAAWAVGTGGRRRTRARWPPAPRNERPEPSGSRSPDTARPDRARSTPTRAADRPPRAVRTGPVVDRKHAFGAAGDQVEAGVGDYPVEPGSRRAPALEAGQPAPGPDERLLERVVGVVHRPEHPVAVRVHRSAVGFDQLVEELLLVHGGQLAHTEFDCPRGPRFIAHPISW